MNYLGFIVWEMSNKCQVLLKIVKCPAELLCSSIELQNTLAHDMGT